MIFYCSWLQFDMSMGYFVQDYKFDGADSAGAFSLSEMSQKTGTLCYYYTKVNAIKA
jgi:hypothetical protein